MKRLLLITTLLFTVTFASLLGARVTAQATHAHPIPSPTRVSAAETDAAEPTIAVAKDGSIFVAWVEHRAQGAADVWLAHFGANGRRVVGAASAVRVNPKIGAATAWRGDPPTLAFAPDGRTIYVGWTARDAAADHAATLYLSASRNGGRTFAPPVRVNDDAKPAARGMHSLAVAADGRVHLAWLDERNVAPPAAHDAKGKTSGHHMEANREVFTAFSADGGRSFSRNSLVARDACPCCKTSLADGTDHRVYVSWRQVLAGDYRHIAVAASGDGGQKFAAPVVVSDDRWLLNGCPVSGAALAVSDDGATLGVVWYTAGEAGAPGIYRSESRDGGRTFAARELVAAGKAQGTPNLIGGEGDASFVVWESREGGATRLTSARLNRAGRVERVNHMQQQGGELPSATATRDGQLFIAFVSKRGDRRAVNFIRADDAAPQQQDRSHMKH